MKISNLSKVIVIIMCSLMLFACSRNDAEINEVREASGTCFITVEDYCDNKEVELNSGDSVYDILKKSGAVISARSSGYGIYIEGINGMYEFDEGPTSGWIYYVNNTKANESCNKYYVSDGDCITWEYIDEI